MIITSVFDIISNTFFMFGYVTNVNSFPHPLTPEDEQYYMKIYKDGNEEARNVLVERNLRLVAHIVKKYNLLRSDMDDLISIGTIGLIKAISTYDSDKGTKFATYASRCIENEILMHIRATKKTQNEVYLQDPIGVDKEGNEIALIDIISNEEETIMEEVEIKMQIKLLFNKMQILLNSREKLVLELRYGLNNKDSKTQREIASMLGISRSYVSRIEKKAIKKLRKNLKCEKDLI